MVEWVLFAVVVAVILIYFPGAYFLWKHTGFCLLCWMNGLFGVEKVDHERT